MVSSESKQSIREAVESLFSHYSHRLFVQNDSSKMKYFQCLKHDDIMWVTLSCLDTNQEFSSSSKLKSSPSKEEKYKTLRLLTDIACHCGSVLSVLGNNLNF